MAKKRGGLKKEWENFQDEQNLHRGCEMEEKKCVFDSEEGVAVAGGPLGSCLKVM